MFLQFCEKNRGQSGFGDYKCRTQKKTKDHVVCRIAKCGKTVGPTLRGFRVQDFTISNAKHQHTTTPELRKCEWNVGPTLRGFGVRDFGVQNFGVYEHLTHKQNEIRNVELRNEIRVWAQQFRVSVFGKAKELRIYVTSKSRMPKYQFCI
jgi:hypothetical protein